MVEHITRYAADKGWASDSVVIQIAEFKKYPKSWRSLSGVCGAFGYKTQFNGADPPGHASPHEAICAWVKRQESVISSKREILDQLTADVARAKDEHAELLAAREEPPA